MFVSAGTARTLSCSCRCSPFLRIGVELLEDTESNMLFLHNHAKIVRTSPRNRDELSTRLVHRTPSYQPAYLVGMSTPLQTPLAQRHIPRLPRLVINHTTHIFVFEILSSFALSIRVLPKSPQLTWPSTRLGRDKE